MSTGNMDYASLPAGVYGRHLCVYEGTYDPDGDSGPALPEEYRVVIREVQRESSRLTRSSTLRRRQFWVKGEADILKAEDGLIECPLDVGIYGGTYLTSITSKAGPREDEWFFDCEYDAMAPNLENGYYSVSINTGGSSIIQTHALDEDTYTAAGITATNFSGAVDVQQTGSGLEIKGVERVIPTMDFTIRAKIAQEYLGGTIWDYADLIAGLTGTVNIEEMFLKTTMPNTYAHQRGELLFLGASGDLIGKDPELQFRFAKSRNISTANGNALTIGDITDIEKEGHKYLWVEHFPKKDTSSNRLTQSIRAVHVSQIYGYGDHRALEIGTLPT